MKRSKPIDALVLDTSLPSVEKIGDFLFITLNRPDQHNRLDPSDIDVIQSVLDNINESLAVGLGPRAVVLQARGSPTFCSGFTIGAISDQLDDRFERMLDSLESLPLPTVAVIQGGVYGGGTDLALCCDIRLGVAESRMFMPAARFAIHYYPGGLRRYVSNLGLAASKKLFLTGLEIEAPEMLRIGFLTEIVEASHLDGRVKAYLEAIGGTQGDVVASMKRHLRGFAEGCPDIEAAANAARKSFKSEESRRRIKALRKT